MVHRMIFTWIHIVPGQSWPDKILPGCSVVVGSHQQSCKLAACTRHRQESAVQFTLQIGNKQLNKKQNFFAKSQFKSSAKVEAFLVNMVNVIIKRLYPVIKNFGSTAVHGKILLVTNASCFLAILEDSWIQHNKKYFWSYQCLTFLVASNLCIFLATAMFEIFLLKSNISLFNSHFPFITLTPQLEVDKIHSTRSGFFGMFV